MERGKLLLLGTYGSTIHRMPVWRLVVWYVLTILHDHAFEGYILT